MQQTHSTENPGKGINELKVDNKLTTDQAEIANKFNA